MSPSRNPAEKKLLTPGGRFRFVGMDDATIDALPQAEYVVLLCAAVNRAYVEAVVCESCGEPLDDDLTICQTCAAANGGAR